MRFLLIISLVVLVSCQKETDDLVSVGETITLKNFSVRIKSIEDSRCPVGMVCIWQGEATVTCEATKGNESHQFSLDLGEYDNPSDTSIMGYKVELLDVQPYPQFDEGWSGTDPAPKEAKLKIEKE